MSDAPTPDLEKRLAALTEWPGDTPGLWRRALSQRQSGTRARKWPKYAAMLGVAAAILVIATPIVMRARESSLRTIERYATDDRGDGVRFQSVDDDGKYRRDLVVGAPMAAGAPAAARDKGVDQMAIQPSDAQERMKALAPDAARIAASPATSETATGDRSVIRKATIEIATGDVRAAFAKAQVLASAARGEFVQDSSITGDDKHLQANLTLRVAAERLSDVLNELRQFGAVRSETTGGEDVTTQVVDLEARLRNEQRVEAELLDLLQKRSGAPLKEVLELRASLSNVRGTIEQLTGQREHLGRLVSLATVLVIIRSSDAPAPEPQGLGAYLRHELQHALRDAGRFLVDSLALIVNVVVGGLVWWIVLLIVVRIVRRAWVRRAAVPAGA